MQRFQLGVLYQPLTWRIGGIMINKGKGSERRKNCRNASLSTFTVGLKPILCGKKPATSCLSTAHDFMTRVLEMLNGTPGKATGSCFQFLQITKASRF
jgi:hypothetical protein